MLIFANLSLATAALLAGLAIALLLRSATASKVLIAASAIFAVTGAIAAVASPGGSMLSFWAFLFGGASHASAVSAAIRLFSHSTRWIHRFVIYAGYAAVFAAMGIVALCLSPRNPSNWTSAVALVLVYILGSVGIFLAKTLTVRIAARKVPEYFTPANLAGIRSDQPYW